MSASFAQEILLLRKKVQHVDHWDSGRFRQWENHGGEQHFTTVLGRRHHGGAAGRHYSRFVKPMHETFIEPSKRHADIIVPLGGLYGVCVGSVFSGESMFYRMRDASKVAFAMLVDWCIKKGVTLIDAQQNTPHLASLGAVEISRKAFLELIQKHQF
jgi:hypothetical protein